MAAVRDIFSSPDKYLTSELSFKEAHKQALAKAEKIAGKTQVYFENQDIIKNKLLIKSISTSDNGDVRIQVSRDGRVIVDGWVYPNSRTIHLISTHEGNPVVEDVTHTFNRVCKDLFLDEKKEIIMDCKSALPPPAEAVAQYQPIDVDPTTPKPNQAQQAAGATIFDRKPIDEASIQMHQGQSSGSPDCGGGCNSKGCTIM